MYLILQKPGIFLREIIAEVRMTLGVDVSESAICKVLKNTGFTRQKLVLFALQRDDALRKQFTADVSLYSKKSLIFIDETGTDSKDTVRSYGYSFEG